VGSEMCIRDRDLFKIEPQEIGKTEVLLTMVGGRAVYESPEWKEVSDRRWASRSEDK